MKHDGSILIVEDSQTQSKRLEVLLKPLGYNIEIAENGKEAHALMRGMKPLLVICDILMPEMDGYTLCQLMKSDDRLRDVPVVLLTQLSDPKEIIRGLECGADDFIIKPYNEELLLARINAVIAIKTRRAMLNRNISILVVEDSPTQAEQLKFLLEEHGYSSQVACNGKVALEMARANRPTLIISDILMPVMDGYELAYEVKRDPQLSNVPIILITSLLDRKEVLRRASVVADGFFTKPFDDSYLLSKVESLIALPHIYDDMTDSKDLEVTFAGEHYVINSGRRQILNFLLSTYESAVQQNRDLILIHRELQALNEQLEERVFERTEQLQASEAKYRNLLETSTDANVVVGSGGRVCFANKAAQELFGKTAEELSSRPFEFPAAPGQTIDLELFSEGKGKVIAEMRAAEIFWGQEKATLAMIRDITGRKLMEEAMRESELNFRALADNASDGILIKTGEDGQIVYANRRISGLSGFSVNELLEKGLTGLTAPERLQEDMALLKRVLKDRPYSMQYESVILRKNGTRLPVEKTASRTLWHGQAATIIIIRDIEERKKKEEELLRASKLESLGTLAGGIAHDFNNLLTGVVGNVSLAKAIIDPDDKVYKMLADLEKASLRAKDLTQQLLTFAKGGTPVKRVVSADGLIKDAANFIIRGSRTKCNFSIADDLWPVEVDEGQITQVIHNLIINAEQAMTQGGSIDLSAVNLAVQGSSGLPLGPGEYVEIVVRDTGMGIPEHQLSRIFDPYFTTKKEGTGLGLATVYSIIKNHGGYITVESKEGHGTAFHIYLPAARGREPVTGKKEESALSGKGRILVMDDEEIVRDVAESILEELGYEVEFAEDGVRAIELYRKAMQEGKPFDAIIMDLTIPGGMGGKDAIKKLLEIDPRVKAIVSSGYSDDSIMSDYRKFGFSAVIAKPYRVAELSRTVYRVVTGEPG